MGSQGEIPVAKEGELYSLKWQTYQGHISSGLQRLYTSNDTESLRDVTLGSEGQYVKAHKVILSLCSPYFRLLFQTNRTENGSLIVILEHLKFKDLKNVLHFIYNGEIKVKNTELKGFLRAGKLLQIEGLAKGKGNTEFIEDKVSGGSSSRREPSSASFDRQSSVSKSSVASSSSIVNPVITNTTSTAVAVSDPDPVSINRTRSRGQLGGISCFSRSLLEDDDVETDLLAMESMGVTVQENNGLNDTGGVVPTNMQPEDGEIFPANMKIEVVDDFYPMDSDDMDSSELAQYETGNGNANDSDYVEYYSTKDSSKLASCGYTYSKRKNSDGITYYYCDKRKICSASVINNKGRWYNGKGWSKKGMHLTHPPDEQSTAVEVLTGRAKKMANEEPMTSAPDILKRAIAEAPPEIQALLPKHEVMCRKLNKSRQSLRPPKRKKYADALALEEYIPPLPPPQNLDESVPIQLALTDT